MSVIEFTPSRNMPAEWQTPELQKLLAGCAASLKQGDASGWAVGQTEKGDPQLYLLGPAPDYDCVLCVSRIGRLYLLEDGNGKILLEHRNLGLLSQQIRAAVSRRRLALMAKAAVLWTTIRHTLEEKVEPLLAEPMEIAAHLSPQLAALA
jgi:hypothetical protein